MLEAAGIHLDSKTVTMILYGLSIGADSIPILGNIKSLIETVVGYDLITGQPLSEWERIVSGLSSVNPFTVLKAVAGAAEAAALAYGISKAEKILGLPSGRLVNSKTNVLTETDVTRKNVRLPTHGNEFFILSGKTSEGAVERVIDPINIFEDSGETSIQFIRQVL